MTPFLVTVYQATSNKVTPDLSGRLVQQKTSYELVRLWLNRCTLSHTRRCVPKVND